jgi:hypothetical protein
MKSQNQVSIENQVWVSYIGEILSNVNNPTMTSFRSKVPVQMNQYLDYWVIDENGKKRKNPNPTRNPYYDEGIINHSRKYKIVTGFDYVNGVNRRRENEGLEGNFEGQENWFEVVSKGLVTDKKTHTKLYFRYQYQLDSTLEQEFLFQDDVIGKELFEQFQKEKSNYENQGTDNTLNFQVCNLDNILEISIGGTKYVREIV